MGYEAIITRDSARILNSSGLVLPGVGAFRDCMKNLNTYGLEGSLYKFIESKKPFLGICLGFQVLFEESEEFGLCKGLGILKGRVVRFPEDKLKIPHMGWNTISLKSKSILFKGMEDIENRFYFVHSFHMDSDASPFTIATCNYGYDFPAVIQKDNIFGAQFHPEKSHKFGIKLYKNFIEA